jgi:hypothetical protein
MKASQLESHECFVGGVVTKLYVRREISGPSTSVWLICTWFMEILNFIFLHKLNILFYVQITHLIANYFTSTQFFQ